MKKQALTDLLELLDIPGPSGREKAVRDHIVRACRKMPGFRGRITIDAAGNLLVGFDGSGKRKLFSAHLDTVPLAVGAKPLVRNGMIRNGTAGKALGGDCRAGCAILLQLIRRISANGSLNGPVTFAFFVEEETGVLGSLRLERDRLGSPPPDRAYVFDGDGAGEVCNASTGADRFYIDIEGKAAHAGINPEEGVSAGLIAARALSVLDRLGWHGRIRKNGFQGSANLGVIRGGEFTNCVMPELHAYAEARSFNQAFRGRIVQAWQRAFRNAAGERGRVSFRTGPCYGAVTLGRRSAVIQSALKTAAQCGIRPVLVKSHGGGDMNRLAAHGIPAATLGMGVYACHTADEYISLPEFHKCCRLGLALLQNG